MTGHQGKWVHFPVPGTWEHAAHVTKSTVRPHMHRKWHPPLSNTKSRLHIFTAFLSNLEVFQPRIRCPYHFLEIPGCWTKVTNLARMSAHVITLYTGWHWPGGGEVGSVQPCKYGNRRQARFDLKIVSVFPSYWNLCLASPPGEPAGCWAREGGHKTSGKCFLELNQTLNICKASF